jgi:tryptophanyl-tRNA synthetase
MTRDVAGRFHAQMGDTFVLPEAQVQQATMYIPGVDGQKMSKSKNNTINIFLPEKALRKQIMSIHTNSTPLEEPKDPDNCNCFALYRLVASEAEVAQMKQNYINGGYGYGHAKQALFEQLLETFKEARQKFDYFMAHQEDLDTILEIGAKRAKLIADDVLHRVREKLGYGV